MDSTKKSKQKSLFPVSENASLTAFYSNSKSHFGNVNHLKRTASEALESGRAKRTKSLFLVENSLDVSSDADCCYSSSFHGRDANSDDEECLSQLFYDKGAKKKLKVLATMVGVESTEPGIVLAKVVAVLKELRMRTGF
ncbi:hypothetical protein SLE2022_160380 [Rubroshorea leprosula]